MISDTWINELLAKNDIASLIGEYTTLTPKGGKLWACCPFHHEKTPSFKVDTVTQLYYCFGCHKGGNAITFIKEKENMTGIEAMKYLADRVGMAMPDSGYNKEEAEKRQKHIERVFNANREAARYYFSNLAGAAEAVDYLTKRGLTKEHIVKFGIGFAPDTWTGCYDRLIEMGYSDKELFDAGLIKRSEKTGKPFDFFRNRIIFPIIDEKSRVLAFGGRTMGDEKPKYLNTGDTLIYSKRNNVYGINMLGRGTHSDIIIVEGYMDAISLHIAGIDNAVATLGTALTENQAKLLKRRTNRIYVSYDGDSAGQNATMRGLDILANAGLEVRVIVLPDGLDPDDFARKYGKDGYMKLKDKSLALNSFKIEHIAKKYDMTNADDRQRFALEAVSLITTMQPVEQERYYEEVSKKTGISYETLVMQGGGMRKTTEKRNNFVSARYNREQIPDFAKSDFDKAELLLTACAARDEQAAKYVMENAIVYFKREETKEFVTLVCEAFKNGEVIPSVILARMTHDVSAISAALAEQEIFEPYKTAVDCFSRLRMNMLKDDLMELSRRFDNHEITIDEYKEQASRIRSEMSRLDIH